MKFLKQALLLAEEDLSELPEDTVKDIQSNISKGAKDTEQKWANALELVHKAYSVSKVQRPSPSMKGGWKQYEENIQFAVLKLSKARGMNGDWRMSSAALHEELSQGELRKFKVELNIPETEHITADVEASDAESIIDMVIKRVKADDVTKKYKLKIEEMDGSTHITFWLHGIRDNSFVRITPVS